MQNKFLEPYTILDKVSVSLPSEMVETHRAVYRIPLSRAIDHWFFHDFSLDLSNNPKLFIPLISKRYRRLYPIISLMGYISDKNWVSLWVVEHLEQDLHRKQPTFTKSGTLGEQMDYLHAQGFSYTDIQEEYLKERFSKNERKRNRK